MARELAPELIDPITAARAIAAAGFTGEDGATMLAVWMAESGLDAHNYHANADGSIDRGIAQINSLHGQPLECVYDVDCSARYSYELYQGRGGFGDWSAYNQGTYLAFVGPSLAAWALIGGAPPRNDLGRKALGDAAGQVGQAAGQAVAKSGLLPDRATVARMGATFILFVVIIAGVIIVTTSTKKAFNDSEAVKLFREVAA